MHGLEKKPRGHGGWEIESRCQLANLDPSRLKTAQGLIDALLFTLESQQVYDGLGAGLHREHPVATFEATDQQKHAGLVLARLWVDAAIPQRFRRNLADEVFAHGAESLRDRQRLKLHREFRASRPNREVF